MTKYAILSIVVFGVVACRPDPGIPDYSAFEGISDAGVVQEVEALPGPFPYEPGDARLFLGIHYEGGRSDQFLIDDNLRRYDVFEGSYDIRAVLDRVEGTFADRFTFNDAPFWGGGLNWEDIPSDLTGWTTMHLSLKSEDPTFAEITLEVRSNDGGAARLNASDYGYVNDGEWHALVVPLTDFSGVDFAAIIRPLIMSGPPGTDGDVLLVDDFYYTKE